MHTSHAQKPRTKAAHNSCAQGHVGTCIAFQSFAVMQTFSARSAIVTTNSWSKSITVGVVVLKSKTLKIDISVFRISGHEARAWTPPSAIKFDLISKPLFGDPRGVTITSGW